jgi:hypothetical protein
LFVTSLNRQEIEFWTARLSLVAAALTLLTAVITLIPWTSLFTVEVQRDQGKVASNGYVIGRASEFRAGVVVIVHDVIPSGTRYEIRAFAESKRPSTH